MQRTIKFRAWETREERMLQSGSFDIHLYCMGYGVSHKFMDEETRQYRFDCCKRNNWDKTKPEVILMQFTGLLDKEGKEIYEGDIVNDSDSCHPYYTVIFNEELAGWDPFVSDGSPGCESPAPKWCKVIGNIYKNPELMKVKE